MPRKVSYEEVKCFFETDGCILLEDKYISAKHPIKYICGKCKQEKTTTWNRFSRNQKCFDCGVVSRSNKRRLSQTYVEHLFQEKGFILIDQYNNSKQKLKYQCVCKNISYTTIVNLPKIKGCKKCSLLIGSKNPKWIMDREVAKYQKIFRKRCNSMIRNSFKSLGMIKKNKCSKILGYDSKELKDYIMCHPNWDKVKNNKWNIDHIFPIKAFIDYNIFDIKLINCLDNLQPLSMVDNFKKNDSYDKRKFEEWLVDKLVQFDTQL